MTVPHHSEPAREAVVCEMTALLDTWKSRMCSGELAEVLISAPHLSAALSASPAPAAGGLEAVREIEAIFRRHLLANDYAKDLIKRIAFDVVPAVRKALSAALAPPTSAATRGEPVAWIDASALPLQKDTRDTSHMAMVYASRSDGFGGQRVALYTSPPAPVESAQVKVKPLVWREFQYTPLRVGFEARTEIGGWRVFEFDEGWAWWRNADSRSAYLTSEASAKAAAQADYESRIRASLATDAEG